MPSHDATGSSTQQPVVQTWVLLSHISNTPASLIVADNPDCARRVALSKPNMLFENTVPSLLGTVGATAVPFLPPADHGISPSSPSALRPAPPSATTTQSVAAPTPLVSQLPPACPSAQLASDRDPLRRNSLGFLEFCKYQFPAQEVFSL